MPSFPRSKPRATGCLISATIGEQNVDRRPNKPADKFMNGVHEMTHIKASKSVTPLTWCYFHEEGMNRYRVWRSDWFNDQFEIMSPEVFNTFKNLAPLLSIPLTEQVED